jgi:hypothetical protein
MSLESFFKDKDTLLLVDNLAKRYGVMPYDILTGQSVYEFNFNVAVMLAVMNIEAELRKEAPVQAGKQEGKEEPTLRDFGIKRTVQKKEKD